LTGASDPTAFQKSIATGVAAKAVGLVNQVVGLALVASALGANGLGSVFLSVSLFSIFNLVPSATIVSLPVRLIEMQKRPSEGRKLVAGAMVIHFAGAGLSLVIGAVAAMVLAAFFPSAFLTPDEVLIAGTMGAVYLATWLAEHVLTAYRKTFIFNLSSLVGSLVSLAATFVAWTLHMRSSAFVGAYYLSIVVPTVSMFACVLLSDLRPAADDFGGAISVARTLWKEGAPGTAYYVWVTTKIHIALSMLALVTMAGEVVTYGACMRVCQLMISGLSLFFSPLLAEAAHAVNDGNVGRYERLRTRVVFGGMALGAVLIVVAGTVGPRLFSYWLSDTVTVSRATALVAGTVVAIWAVEALLFYLTSALRQRERLGRDLLVASVFALTAGLALATQFGAAGMLATIGAVSSLVVLRLLRFDAAATRLPMPVAPPVRDVGRYTN
jgi:hypothetical protein